jgi:hypothetical protein
MNAIRATHPSGAGSSASPTSTVTAMTSTFAIVPIPGRCRSGIHSSSTAAPVTAVIRPKLSGVCRLRPSCSTSHGLSPSVARICIAIENP